MSDVGAGYAVTFQGPPADASFATGWPNSGALTHALAAGNGLQATYERAWRDRIGGNSVQILLLRFSSAASAGTFSTLADRTLESPTVVSSGPLPAVPGARLSTYVGGAGFGQAVVLRAGGRVALLSFVSDESPRAAPITAADVERVAEAQHSTLERARRVWCRGQERTVVQRPDLGRAGGRRSGGGLDHPAGVAPPPRTEACRGWSRAKRPAPGRIGGRRVRAPSEWSIDQVEPSRTAASQGTAARAAATASASVANFRIEK